MVLIAQAFVKILTALVLAVCFIAPPAAAQIRIKDIVDMEGVRDNQLVGGYRPVFFAVASDNGEHNFTKRGGRRRVNDVVFLTPTNMQVSKGGNKFTELRMPVVDGGILARQFGSRMGMYERGR